MKLAARHAGAGAAGEVVRQLFEDPAGPYQVSRTDTRQTRTAVETMVPVVYPVETMGCGPSSPLNRNLGYYKTVGYRYMEEPFTETTTVQGKAPGLLERAAGVAMAGLSSAVFGGLLPEMTGRQDAALGAVSGSVWGKSGKASELSTVVKGTKEWNDAVKNIANGGNTSYRTRTATEAKELLNEARGNMNRYKQYTSKQYKKGYEMHPNEINTRNAPHNDLPHIKWKDWLGESYSGKGHLFFDIPN